MKQKIYLSLAQMGGNELQFIQNAFDTNWVVPLGPNVDAFERELEKFIGQNRYVVALSAGTAAIHLGLVLLNVQAGDEVICQSFTFAASANPVTYLGATPVLSIPRRRHGICLLIFGRGYSRSLCKNGTFSESHHSGAFIWYACSNRNNL